MHTKFAHRVRLGGIYPTILVIADDAFLNRIHLEGVHKLEMNLDSLKCGSGSSVFKMSYIP